jgi:hypothetical protein
VDYELTAHARLSLLTRDIATEWLEQVLEAPERTEPDPVDADLEHRMERIKAHEGRWLRVIVKKQSSPVRVITMYFDRKLRRA